MKEAKVSNKSNVIWNYIGTTVSMLSGFLLLPLLMAYLSADELGLWYVYVAVANLAMLFEFGFNPTFARNIVYVISGTRRLTSTGKDSTAISQDIDFHLLNVVIRTCKIIYAVLAALVLILLSTVGTAYIWYITSGMNAGTVWSSWVLFCVSIFLNLYFLYSITLLRGYGDVAGENKAKTFAKLSQLIVSAVLLLRGAGLIGAAIGYLVNALLLRVAALILLKGHAKIEIGRKSDTESIKKVEIKETFFTVGHLAWKDGLVQIALYCSTQATSILSSLFLGLAETGTYSVLLQLSTAVCNFAGAYPKSFFPSMQAAFARGDNERQRQVCSTGMCAYWFLFIVGTVGVCIVVLPLLPIFKPDIRIDYLLYIALSIYLALLHQHSIICSYIISRNEIPYMGGYIAAAVVGVALCWFLCDILGLGVWGLVAGQFASQLLYNNWKWPMYFSRKLDTTYLKLIKTGWSFWCAKLKRKQI